MLAWFGSSELGWCLLAGLVPLGWVGVTELVWFLWAGLASLCTSVGVRDRWVKTEIIVTPALQVMRGKSSNLVE